MRHVLGPFIVAIYIRPDSLRRMLTLNCRLPLDRRAERSSFLLSRSN